MQSKILIATLMLALGACSPHPGAGGWHALSDGALFERLEIRYDGKADFYKRKDDQAAAWRCFWASTGKHSASMKCIDATNSNNEQIYSFLVEKEIKEGRLQLGEQVLGRYGWQAPTEAVED